MLRPIKFFSLKTQLTVPDPLGKVRVNEFMEDGHTNQYAIMEAQVKCDKGLVVVRLKDGIHFTYIDGKLVVKIDASSFKNVFKGVLLSYNIAYVTEKTYRQYQKEIQNPNLTENTRHDWPNTYS